MNKFWLFLSTSINLLSLVLLNFIFISSFFSENIRSNLSALISILLNNGVIGYYVILIILTYFLPLFKFWYFIFQDKTINYEVIKSSIISTEFERKTSNWIYTLSFILLVIYLFYSIA
mgnify:FL=1